MDDPLTFIIALSLLVLVSATFLTSRSRKKKSDFKGELQKARSKEGAIPAALPLVTVDPDACRILPAALRDSPVGEGLVSLSFRFAVVNQSDSDSEYKMTVTFAGQTYRDRESRVLIPHQQLYYDSRIFTAGGNSLAEAAGTGNVLVESRPSIQGGEWIPVRYDFTVENLKVAVNRPESGN